jgi:hypothetical protein
MNLQETIKRVLREDDQDRSERLKSKIMFMIKNGSFLTAIRSVGGYDNLRKIMKGTDYLSKDVMVSTIKEILKGKGDLGLYGLGIDPITIRIIGNEVHNIEVISDNDLGVDVYVDYDDDDADGDYDAIDGYNLSYDDIKINDLFELFGGIIEYYENYSNGERID